MIKKTPVDIELPLGRSGASKLRLGQVVTVSGTVFTGRSRFHIRAVEEKILPQVDFSEVNCFFHVGPVMKMNDAGWEVVSIEPTSSIRFERYAGDVIRKLELRVVMGKTTLGKRSGRALSEIGGVYLSKIGICGNMLAKQVKTVRGVYFLDELGKTEATWIFDVEKFGPFFVAIDARGNNYFEELRRDSEKNAAGAKKALGIPEGFSLTEV